MHQDPKTAIPPFSSSWLRNLLSTIVKTIMPQNTKGTVFPFPGGSKPVATEENDVFAELKAVLGASTPTPPSASSEPTQTVHNSPITLHIAIHGDGNQFSTGSISNSTLPNKSPPAPIVAAKPEKPVINAVQKRQLLDLRDDIETISAECDVPKHPAAIMSALNMHLDVKKYHQIVVEQFDKARNYLWARREAHIEFRASLQMRKEFRDQMISAIHAHHKEMGERSKLFAYLSAEIEKDATLNLPTSKLEELYRTLMSEK